MRPHDCEDHTTVFVSLRNVHTMQLVPGGAKLVPGGGAKLVPGGAKLVPGGTSTTSSVVGALEKGSAAPGRQPILLFYIDLIDPC